MGYSAEQRSSYMTPRSSPLLWPHYLRGFVLWWHRQDSPDLALLIKRGSTNIRRNQDNLCQTVTGQQNLRIFPQPDESSSLRLLPTSKDYYNRHIGRP